MKSVTNWINLSQIRQILSTHDAPKEKEFTQKLTEKIRCGLLLVIFARQSSACDYFQVSWVLAKLVSKLDRKSTLNFNIFTLQESMHLYLLWYILVVHK